MNRRKALFLTMLLGGLLPRRLLAQTPGASGRSRKTSDTATARPVRRASEDAEQIEDVAPLDNDALPGDFPNEAGQQWRKFDISKYTSLEHSQNNPQTAIIEWIFRRTESAPWHSDKVAVLCAGTQLRAYHTPAVLRQVVEMVERFTDSTADLLSVRVRFVTTADTRWRYAVNSRLNLLGSGPQGQQIWTLKLEDATMVLGQMQTHQAFKLVADRRFEMINGQTIFMQSSVSRNYVAGLQRDSAAGLGYQQALKQIDEGVVLRLSPLLSFEGDTLDAAVEFRANTIRALHNTVVLAPREVGPGEMTIEVPEVTETRLNQTVRGWPLGQTLLISAGIHPGILQSKTGFMNLRIPGTVPTSTELLAFVEIETNNPKTARSRKREASE